MLNQQLRQTDEKFENFLDSVIFENNNTDLTPFLAQKRRKSADSDDLEFCRIYYPGIFNEPWNDIHKHIALLEKGNYTVSGARKFGKSAFTYAAKAVKRIALGGGGIVNISMRTVENGSRERTAAIARLIKRNKKLIYDYNIEFQQEKKGHYIINNTVLVATSVEVGLRGIIDDEFKRFSISICDDLYNKNSVSSVRDNEKVTEFVQSEVYGQMEENGLCITLGNSINDDCPIVRLKAENPQNHFSLPALDENGETNWQGHSLFTTEYLKRKSMEMPFDVWMGEWMDNPLQKGDVFDIAWMRSINANLLKIIASVSAIDPSQGESPAACYKAIATLGITEKRETVMLDIYIRKEGYHDVFNYVDELRHKTPSWKILLFENDFGQWGFAKPYYDEWCTANDRTIPIWFFTTKELKTEYYSSDKTSRILNLVHPHQTGKFYYSNKLMEGSGQQGQALTNDFKLYRSQYVSVGKSKEKLDGVDAAATAFVMLPRWINTGSFHSANGKNHTNGNGWLSFKFNR